jgi:hypothetical protein
MLTQKECLLRFFRNNDNRLTLGQLLVTTLAAEYRARMTELRRDGYGIELVRGKRPENNLYILHEKEELLFDKNGQRLII